MLNTSTDSDKLPRYANWGIFYGWSKKDPRKIAECFKDFMSFQPSQHI